jgi:hypothetical protein
MWFLVHEYVLDMAVMVLFFGLRYGTVTVMTSVKVLRVLRSLGIVYMQQYTAV